MEHNKVSEEGIGRVRLGRLVVCSGETGELVVCNDETGELVVCSGETREHWSGAVVRLGIGLVR